MLLLRRRSVICIFSVIGCAISVGCAMPVVLANNSGPMGTSTSTRTAAPKPAPSAATKTATSVTKTATSVTKTAASAPGAASWSQSDAKLMAAQATADRMLDRDTVLETKLLPIAECDGLVRTSNGTKLRAVLDGITPTAANTNLLHIWRGVSYWMQQRYEQAVVEFDAATNLSETSLTRQSKAAETYQALESSSKAVKIWNDILAKCPFGKGFERRASCYRAMHRYEEAVADYKQGAAISPDHRRGYLAKAADILRGQHKYTEALVLLDKSVEDGSDIPHPLQYLSRAACLEEVNRWQEAATDCTTALKLANMPLFRDKHRKEAASMILSRAYVERAKCYDHLGKKALADADRKTHESMSSSLELDLIGGGK
jgi:tetratricopeptide (TPR) repeat protein